MTNLPKLRQTVRTEIRKLAVQAGAGADGADVTGRIFYVDSVNGSASGTGLRSDDAVTTLALAVTASVAGDTIVLLEGHAETVTAITTLSKANVKIIGHGIGAQRPAITANSATDTITVTAASVLIENILFNEATSVTGGAINVGAVDCTIRGCQFDLGANDAEAITIEAAGDNLTVEDCFFNVTANGPTAAIEIEANGVDSLTVRNNIFRGGGSTNTWDNAAVHASTTTTTNLRVHGNEFTSGTAILAATTVSSAIYDNTFGVGCRATAETPITLYADGARTTVGDGTKQDPTTIVDAVNRATVSGDVVILNGVATVTTALAMDSAGVTLMAMYDGAAEIANDTDDAKTITVTAARCRIKNILFSKGAANSSDGTELIDINSGGDYLIIEDCIFDMETRANADVINIATGTKGTVIRRCRFTDLATVKTAIAWAGSAGVIEDNIFDFSAADAVMSEQLASPGDGTSFRRNVLVSDDTSTAVASWQAAPGEQIFVNNIFCSVAAGTGILGADDDLDPWCFDNIREKASTPIGVSETIDPSI